MNTYRRRGLVVGGVVAVVAVGVLVGGYALIGSDKSGNPSGPTAGEAAVSLTQRAAPSTTLSSPSPTLQLRQGLAGMPAYYAADLYFADRPNELSDSVKDIPSYVYVPNSDSDTVSIINPATYKVVRTVPVGHQPQHVVPSWDMQTLWVNNDLGNSLTPINPRTGAFGKPIPVNDPYNLYFTPDGKSAIVMAEALHEIVFRDPHTMAIQDILSVPCSGVNHADFSPDGTYFIASCEFSGDLVKVDTATHKLIGVLKLKTGAMPQDVKIAPDGSVWYVADMQNSGLWTVAGNSFKATGFIPTGLGAHGLYVSRDSKSLYVSNRGEGSITVLDFATRKARALWKIPGHASPDMGGVSADGKVLWLTGRYDSEIYAISTIDGHLLARIKVGNGPHGLCVYPQPGRYSLGHTGIFR